MKEYLTSIMAVSVASALVSLLVPDGKASKKYLKFVIGAVSLLAVAEPLCGLADIRELPKTDLSVTVPSESENGYIDAVIKNAEDIIASEMTEELFTRYRLSERYVGVCVELDASDPSEVTVNEMIITLKSYGSWADSRAISEYFSDKYGCEVKISYE